MEGPRETPSTETLDAEPPGEPIPHSDDLGRLAALVTANKTALAHYDLDEFKAGILDELDLGDCVIQWGLDRYQVCPFEGGSFTVPAGKATLAILRGLVRYSVVSVAPDGWVRYPRQKPCIEFELDDSNLVYVCAEREGEEDPGFGYMDIKEGA